MANAWQVDWYLFEVLGRKMRQCRLLFGCGRMEECRCSDFNSGGVKVEGSLLGAGYQ